MRGLEEEEEVEEEKKEAEVDASERFRAWRAAASFSGSHRASIIAAPSDPPARLMSLDLRISSSSRSSVTTRGVGWLVEESPPPPPS